MLALSAVHVQLPEDFKRGRFSRNKGDYLCSPKKVPNWGDGGNYTEVTCKSCLKRAAALNSKTHQPIPDSNESTMTPKNLSLTT